MASLRTRHLVELYEFTMLGETYRYTNAGKTLVINGITYDNIVIRRGRVENPSNDSPNSLLRIQMDGLSAFIFDFDKVLETAMVKVLKYDVDDETLFQIHNGPFNSIEEYESYNEHPLATIAVETKYKGELRRKLPNRSYTPYCGVPLYSNPCGIRRALYTSNNTISTISGTGLNLTAGQNLSVRRLGTQIPPTNYFRYGAIKRVKSGSVRSITYQSNRLVQVHYPFFDLEVGDQVEILAGCDHTIETCREKFDNIDNFRGFTNVPELDSTTEDLSGYVDNKISIRDDGRTV